MRLAYVIALLSSAALAQGVPRSSGQFNGSELTLRGSAPDSRDNPENGIIFQNTGLPNNPKFLVGNPYLAGIGLEAWGVWYKDDTLPDWRIILSGERSGTFAAVLDGVRRSSVEAFIQNGDQKPWFRIEASAQALQIGPGGCEAAIGDAVRAAGVLTITCETEHKFGVGQRLYKQPAPGYSGEVAVFGTNGENWGPGGTTMTVASVTDAYTFTVTDARANATSTEPMTFSTEVDVHWARGGASVAEVRVATDGIGTMGTVGQFTTTGLVLPSGLSVLSSGSALGLGASGTAPAEVTASQLHVKEGFTFYNEGYYRSTGWFNGGGQTQTSQETFVVSTSSGNKTTFLPDIAGRDWLVLRIKNRAEGTANTLTITPDTGETIDLAADLIIPAESAVTLVSNGTNWEVFYHPPPP